MFLKIRNYINALLGNYFNRVSDIQDQAKQIYEGSLHHIKVRFFLVTDDSMDLFIALTDCKYIMDTNKYRVWVDNTISFTHHKPIILNGNQRFFKINI